MMRKARRPDVREILTLLGRISIGIGILLILVMMSLLLLLPSLPAISADLAIRAAQSFIVVFGLILTVSTATAVLSARSAHSILREMESMQVFQKKHSDTLKEAINTAEKLQDGVFWLQLTIFASALSGVIISFVILLTATGSTVPLPAILSMFGLLTLGVGLMLFQLRAASRLGSIVPHHPPAPDKPCPKCRSRLTFVQEYRSAYCETCKAYW